MSYAPPQQPAGGQPAMAPPQNPNYNPNQPQATAQNIYPAPPAYGGPPNVNQPPPTMAPGYQPPPNQGSQGYVQPGYQQPGYQQPGYQQPPPGQAPVDQYQQPPPQQPGTQPYPPPQQQPYQQPQQTSQGYPQAPQQQPYAQPVPQAAPATQLSHPQYQPPPQQQQPYKSTGIIESANNAARAVEKSSGALGREINKVGKAIFGTALVGGVAHQAQQAPPPPQPNEPPKVYHQAVLEIRSDKSMGGLVGGNYTSRQFTLQGWTLAFYDGHRQQSLDLRGCAITLAPNPNGFILTGPSVPKQRMELRAKKPADFQAWMDAFKLAVPIYQAPAQ